MVAVGVGAAEALGRRGVSNSVSIVVAPSTAGQGTVVAFTTGGFGYAFAQNGNKSAGVETSWGPVKDIAEARSWPARDLFPDYGMKTLADTRIRIVTPVLAKKLTVKAAEQMVQRSMAPQRVEAASASPKPKLELTRKPRVRAGVR